MLELVSVGTISKFNKRLLILFLMDIGNASIYPFLFWLHPPLAFLLIICHMSLHSECSAKWCKKLKKWKICFDSTMRWVHSGQNRLWMVARASLPLPYWITIIPYRRQESSPTLYNNTITINILSQFNIFCQRAKFLTSHRLTAMQIFQWNCSPWFIS